MPQPQNEQIQFKTDAIITIMIPAADLNALFKAMRTLSIEEGERLYTLVKTQCFAQSLAEQVAQAAPAPVPAANPSPKPELAKV